MLSILLAAARSAFGKFGQKKGGRCPNLGSSSFRKSASEFKIFISVIDLFCQVQRGAHSVSLGSLSEGRGSASARHTP